MIINWKKLLSYFEVCLIILSLTMVISCSSGGGGGDEGGESGSIIGTWDLTGISSKSNGETYYEPESEIAEDPLSRTFNEDGTGIEYYWGTTDFTWVIDEDQLTIVGDSTIIGTYTVNSTTLTFSFKIDDHIITHTFTRRSDTAYSSDSDSGGGADIDEESSTNTEVDISSDTDTNTSSQAGTDVETNTNSDTDTEIGIDANYTNSLGMTFNLIPAGTFIMGSPEDELGRSSDENQHQVTLTQPFYIQTMEITQSQWKAVMGSNPSSFDSCGNNCPVEDITYNDVKDFITKLNGMEMKMYRLPTESEWEYACRAGSTTAFSSGQIITTYGSDPNLNKMGWYKKNSEFTTHPVAQKNPNEWGLYDMHGNVSEWCSDLYEEYLLEPVINPTGASSGSQVVFRGGDWATEAYFCRAAARYPNKPDGGSGRVGFRLAMTADESYPSTNWYKDLDGDGFGNPMDSKQSVTQPAGYVLDNTDPDDSEEAIYPGSFSTTDNGDGSVDTDSDYINSFGLTFNLIPAGTFIMGSPEDELGRHPDETQHQVTLTQSFYMQTTEVTQEQWNAVMNSDDISFVSCGDNCPKVKVSLSNVQNFIDELNKSGEGTYRLPTEAEWEYACRSGSSTAFANGEIVFYSDTYWFNQTCNYDETLDAIGWYCGNSVDIFHPVAQKQSNAWGLFDMHGNVWEMCLDRYEENPSGPVTDPMGPISGDAYVLRGGSWLQTAVGCRSAERGSNSLSASFYTYIGFRLVREP